MVEGYIIMVSGGWWVEAFILSYIMVLPDQLGSLCPHTQMARLIHGKRYWRVFAGSKDKKISSLSNTSSRISTSAHPHLLILCKWYCMHTQAQCYFSSHPIKSQSLRFSPYIYLIAHACAGVPYSILFLSPYLYHHSHQTGTQTFTGFPKCLSGVKKTDITSFALFMERSHHQMWAYTPPVCAVEKEPEENGLCVCFFFKCNSPSLGIYSYLENTDISNTVQVLLSWKQISVLWRY